MVHWSTEDDTLSAFQSDTLVGQTQTRFRRLEIRDFNFAGLLLARKFNIHGRLCANARSAAALAPARAAGPRRQL
jgi:hypothetical protein